MKPLYRTLAFSALLTVYQKKYIGKLSAFCIAVCAACSAGAAITYIVGTTLAQIKDIIGNTFANIPGIICDGVKASCAAKISSALDAAIFAHSLAMNGKAGMHPADREIVKIILALNVKEVA